MPDACTLQLHSHGSWQDVATITLGTGLGVDEEVIEHLRPGILAQARQLQALK